MKKLTFLGGVLSALLTYSPTFAQQSGGGLAPSTAVTAGSYGSATQVPTFTVGADGRLTASLNVTMTPAWGNITGTPTTLAGYGITNGVSSARQVLAGTGLSGGGDLTIDRTLTSNAVEHISYQPGLLTAVNATKAVFHKFSKAATVDNIEGSAATFSCVSDPTITMFECGTSATCASSPVTIGTVTVTAAGTVVDGTVSSAAITAGDYVAFAMTAGTCASIDVAATAQIHEN